MILSEEELQELIIEISRRMTKFSDIPTDIKNIVDEYTPIFIYLTVEDYSKKNSRGVFMYNISRVNIGETEGSMLYTEIKGEYRGALFKDNKFYAIFSDVNRNSLSRYILDDKSSNTKVKKFNHVTSKRDVQTTASKIYFIDYEIAHYTLYSYNVKNDDVRPIYQSTVANVDFFVDLDDNVLIFTNLNEAKVILPSGKSLERSIERSYDLITFNGGYLVMSKGNDCFLVSPLRDRDPIKLDIDKKLISRHCVFRNGLSLLDGRVFLLKPFIEKGEYKYIDTKSPQHTGSIFVADTYQYIIDIRNEIYKYDGLRYQYMSTWRGDGGVVAIGIKE